MDTASFTIATSWETAAIFIFIYIFAASEHLFALVL